jgi:hypothetical protein
VEELELINVSISLAESVQNSISLYLTIITAYLLAAHFVGSKLSIFQVFVISVLFVVFGLSFVAAIQVDLWNLLEIGYQIQGLRPSWLTFPSPMLNWGFLVIDSVGVVVSLAFMWSVRHRKAE